ncbi:MAG: hypothetical protein KC468_37200 [Myxococcales bacterium]|nr:hypothetical protein [Myxococcales bacterium]
MSSQNGTLLRSADGKLYFLRDELLAAAEVTEPEMLDYCNSIVESGRAIEGAPIDRVVQASVPTRSIKDTLGAKAMSTVMCPGVMHDGSVRVLESAKSMIIEGNVAAKLGRGIKLNPRG